MEKESSLLLGLLREGPCEDCRKNFPIECMEFDHVPERGKKEYGINILLIGCWEKLLMELFKCDLVCSNCHRIREKKRYKEDKHEYYFKNKKYKKVK